jgi:RecA-family ATPase
VKPPEIWTIDEFCEVPFDFPPFLMGNIIPQGGIGIFHGKRSHGKTQLALTLAVSLINGTPFLERYKCPYGRVTYVGLDMPVQEVQDRCKRILPKLQYPERFQIVASMDPINLPEMFFKGKQPEWVTDVTDFEPDLIIIDTLRKSHFLDENLNSTPGFVYAASRGLFGTHSTVTFLHHDRKTSESTRGAPQEERVAGAGAWVDNSDFAIHVGKRRDRVTVSFPRVRFCQDQPSIMCEFDPDTLLIRLKEDKKTAYDHAVEIQLKDPNLDYKGLVGKLMEDHDISQTQAYEAAKKATGK